VVKLELEVELETHLQTVLKPLGVSEIRRRRKAAHFQIERRRERLLDLQSNLTVLVGLSGELDARGAIHSASNGEAQFRRLEAVNELTTTAQGALGVFAVNAELGGAADILDSASDGAVLEAAVVKTGDVLAAFHVGNLALAVHDKLEAADLGDFGKPRNVGGGVHALTGKLDETVDGSDFSVEFAGVAQGVVLGFDFILGGAVRTGLLREAAGVTVSLLLDLEVDAAILKTLEVDLLLVLTASRITEFVSAVVADLENGIGDLQAAHVPLGEEAGFSTEENLFEFGAGFTDVRITEERHCGKN